jgi:RNA polymerase sigma factor (TIGR02999 family)
MEPHGEVTRLIGRLRVGDARAYEELLPIVYDELRTMARRQLRGERSDHTLDPTALVHEAYLRLVGDTESLTDRRHFFAVAARAMRRILIEHARARARQKRGGGRQRVELPSNLAGEDTDPVDAIALDEALTRLETVDARKARVVELLYYVGLSAREAGEVLEITSRTVERDWQFARAWLLRELTPGTG